MSETGDQRAFAAIYRRYHQDLYRFCLAIVGNSQDAQDALQNTMVKVLRALPGEQRQIKLKPWLYRIAHNESVELLRRRRPTEELDPERAAAGRSLAEDAEARERLRQLIADLDLLPERQRGALVMRELSGLDYDEIGAALGTSPAVARQTLYEARLSLRQMDAGREMTCDVVIRALSDADGRVARRRDIRAHLRACPDCRGFRDDLERRHHDLAALSPLPAVAAAGLLQGVLGGAVGGSAASGAGLAGAVGGGAAKSLGATAAVKSAAAVAVVAVVGVGAAQQGDLVDVVPGSGGASQQAESERPAGSGAGPAGALPTRGSVGAGVVRGKDRSAAVRSGRALQAGVRPGEGSLGQAGSGAGAADEGTPTVAGPGSTGTHPRGRGHEKQHPSAAAPGQETAASHKASGKGVKAAGKGSGGRSTQAHPSHPPKPAKPPKPVHPVAPDGGKAGAPKKAPPESGPAAQPPPPAPRSPEPKEAPDKSPGLTFQP